MPCARAPSTMPGKAPPLACRVPPQVVLVLLSAWVSAASASSLQVAPVRLVLTPGHPVAAMTVGNGEDSELAMQAEVLEWSQEQGQDVYRATRDVVVNPALFRVPAHGQQIVRIGLQVDSHVTERSYRIFLQQLPRDHALGVTGAGTQVQTLLRVGVPIFVPPTAFTAQVAWQLQPAPAAGAGTLTGHRLVIENQGSEHVQLQHLTLQPEGGGAPLQTTLSQYVLAGQRAVVPLALPALLPGTVWQVRARSDAATALPAAAVQVPRANPNEP